MVLEQDGQRDDFEESSIDPRDGESTKLVIEHAVHSLECSDLRRPELQHVASLIAHAIRHKMVKTFASHIRTLIERVRLLKSELQKETKFDHGALTPLRACSWSIPEMFRTATAALVEDSRRWSDFERLTELVAQDINEFSDFCAAQFALWEEDLDTMTGDFRDEKSEGRIIQVKDQLEGHADEFIRRLNGHQDELLLLKSDVQVSAGVILRGTSLSRSPNVVT